MNEIDLEDLASVSGGLQWEKFGQSRNVEDRRSPAGIRRDSEWWERTHRVPLPPRRPPGL